jgi:serine/threonine protein kinase
VTTTAVLGARYRVLDLVGRGGMADVHRAVDEVLGRQVAVKVFRVGAGAENERRRFEFEVRLAASLDHRQLVRVYDAGIDGEHRWCVMQLVPGGTLADLPTPVPAATAAAIGADVAEALAYLHERGKVHRDVKPSNVLAGEHGEAYLSDFGICGVAGDADARLGGPALGTPAYLSPEQVRGEPAAPAGGDPVPSPADATGAPPTTAPAPRPSPSVTPAPDAADPSPVPSPTGNAPDGGGAGPGTGAVPAVPPDGGVGGGSGGGPGGSPGGGPADDAGGTNGGAGKGTGADDDDEDDDEDDD